MMRLFVTGSTGMLGTALVRHFQASGIEVSAAPGRAGSAAGADLTVRSDVMRLLDGQRPDAILNLAALTDVDYCERNPSRAYAVNAGIALNLASWIESSHPDCRLVHISTDQVYDGVGPHAERDVRPLNYYAYSKCLAEEYVRRVDGVSLRTNFFGPSARAGRSSFSDWLVSAMREGRAISVFEDVLFSPLSMATLIAAIARVLAAPVPGVFNLGGSGGVSKADFAFQLAEAAALSTAAVRRASVTGAKLVAQRPNDMRMDSALFEKAYAVSLPTVVDEIQKVGRGYRGETS
jgi:dTDP-4-dehydrorhamnose reductase